VIESHGTPGQLEFIDYETGQKRMISGTELGRELAARGFQGDQVVLVVCHAGSEAEGGGSTAQDLTDELKRQTGRDVEVIAANGTVANFSDGSLVAVQTLRDIHGNEMARVEGYADATFQSFSAGRPPRPAPGTDGSGVWPPLSS
jgi:hypothetical protein